jgi:uncharacterized membrane protein YphA (DoxX/SURF4 family)
MAFEATGTGEALLLGRILFAVVLIYLALGNLLDLSEAIGYAASKGVPAPRVTVPLGSLSLVVGAISVLVGAFPLVGSLTVLGFLLGITPFMHDFWNQEDVDRQNEQIHFLKNVGLAGAALLFVALSTTSWPYALEMSL